MKYMNKTTNIIQGIDKKSNIEIHVLIHEKNKFTMSLVKEGKVIYLGYGDKIEEKKINEINRNLEKVKS